MSPEFKLAVSACGSAFKSGHNGAADALDCARLDWPRFLRTVRFHRIQGLVWSSLCGQQRVVPDHICDALAADVRAITADNLRLAAEARALRALFESAEIRLIFVKGLTVGALAYSQPLLKVGWDLDLLIDPRRLNDAVTLLGNRGYRLVHPRIREKLKSWHHWRKESEWERHGIHVELHTRLTENPRLLPEVGVYSALQEVAVIPGVSLPTLADDPLFAYLCMHGASSLWFRLKWITDLAAILDKVGTAEIQRLHRRACELGAGRASGSALMLADWLYRTLEGSTLRAVLANDRSVRWLAGAALHQLAYGEEPCEPTAVRGGTVAIHLSQLLLVPGPSFKVAELWRQLRTALGENR